MGGAYEGRGGVNGGLKGAYAECAPCVRVCVCGVGGAAVMLFISDYC